jgi:hypothetical protein
LRLPGSGTTGNGDIFTGAGYGKVELFCKDGATSGKLPSVMAGQGHPCWKEQEAANGK